MVLRIAKSSSSSSDLFFLLLLIVSSFPGGGGVKSAIVDAGLGDGPSEMSLETKQHPWSLPANWSRGRGRIGPTALVGDFHSATMPRKGFTPSIQSRQLIDRLA